MSNILPVEAKQSVWNMYRARFIIAGSLFVIVAAVLAILALLPSYLVLATSADGSSQASALANASVQADGAAIAQGKSLLATLSPLVSATTTPTDAIAAALALRPAGISVNHLTYTAGRPGTLVIVGTGSPAGISAYNQALTVDPLFTNVSVPIGDLVGAQGGQFSITASGNF